MSPRLVRDGDFSGVVSRSVSMWPFASRTVRLHLLVDPTTEDPVLIQGLLAAMREAYGQAQGRSHTTAVREALFAVHYVLRNHNRAALPSQRVTAAAACAAVQDGMVYVGLAGDAAALAAGEAALRRKLGASRPARPLGGEAVPNPTFWTTALGPREQLALACRAAWQDETFDQAESILSRLQGHAAADALVDLLSGPQGPARLTMAPGSQAPGFRQPVAPAGRAEPEPRRHHQAPRRGRAPVNPAPAETAAREGRSVAARRAEAAPRAAWPRLPLLLGAAIVVVLLLGLGMSRLPFGTASDVAYARESSDMLDQAAATHDSYRAYQLAASAVSMAQKAEAAHPGAHADLVAHAEDVLRDVDRAYRVDTATVVDLGGASSNVVDLAVDVQHVYTLDASAGAVIAYPLDASAGGSPILAQGMTADGKPVAAPIALAEAEGDQAGLPLMVLDQSRGLFSVSPGQPAHSFAWSKPVAWQGLAAAARAGSSLYAVDDHTGTLHAYELPNDASQPVRETLSVTLGSDSPLAKTVEMHVSQDLYVRTSDGAVARLDHTGRQLPFAVHPPDSQPGPIEGLTPDGAGGLYLADPANDRVIQVAADGSYVRQIHPATVGAFASLRDVDVRDNSLFGVVNGGIIRADLPDEIPAAIPGSGGGEAPSDGTPPPISK